VQNRQWFGLQESSCKNRSQHVSVSMEHVVLQHLDQYSIYHFYAHGPGAYIKSLQLTGLFTCFELGTIIAALLLATPVTLTLLYDVRLGLLVQRNFAVILFCPCLITVGFSL
jgi:hypothetical protein